MERLQNAISCRLVLHFEEKKNKEKLRTKEFVIFYNRHPEREREKLLSPKIIIKLCFFCPTYKSLVGI